MLKMRLQRIGRKNDPSYRVVVVDSRQGVKSGKFIDLIGTVNPKLDHVAIKGEKVTEWLAKGVQASPTVHNLLINQKIITGKKINVLPRKSPIAKEGAETVAEAPAAVEAPAADTAPEVVAEAPAEAPVAEEVAVETPAEVSAETSEEVKA